MEHAILEIKDISKYYNDIKALDQLGFSLNKGEIFGLLGPNGAGKTTLISILSGTVKDFSGSVRFNGEDLFANRRLKDKIGIVPQDMAFYEDLNAMDNLLFWGGLYNISPRELKQRALSLLDTVELSTRSKEPVKNFSGGMKRRLNIAIGLIHQPDLLLLDEPTVGIDVQAKVRILDIIKKVGEGGTSVIFTTHQLTEVEEICRRIAIMDKGSILASGTLEELITLVEEKEVVDISGDFDSSRITHAVESFANTHLLAVEDNLVTIGLDNTDQLPGVLSHLFKNNIEVTDIKIKSPSLETVFLKLTGRSLRD